MAAPKCRACGHSRKFHDPPPYLADAKVETRNGRIDWCHAPGCPCPAFELEADWHCLACRLRNFPQRTRCYRCGEKRIERPLPRIQAP
jgi:hypothetical protein